MYLSAQGEVSEKLFDAHIGGFCTPSATSAEK
jgi:hypothetical protein